MAKKHTNLPSVDLILSPARMAELEAQAAGRAADELQEEAERQFLEAAVERKKRELSGQDAEPLDTDEAVEDVHIDLAPHAASIRLDGRVFFHGLTYKVTLPVKASILEIAARTWAHEREIGNANANSLNQFRQPHNARV